VLIALLTLRIYWTVAAPRAAVSLAVLLANASNSTTAPPGITHHGRPMMALKPHSQRAAAAVLCRCEPQDAAAASSTIAASASSDEGTAGGNGSAAATGTAAATADTPTILNWEEPSPARKALTRLYLSFALPWRRFKENSYVVIKLEGAQAQPHSPLQHQQAAAVRPGGDS
jgi:hypothetical protein